MKVKICSSDFIFQSTPLIRGATVRRVDARLNEFIFQSTPLIRGATRRRSRNNAIAVYFNPRPSYEERRAVYEISANARDISIHAPHTRSDGPDEV